MSAHNHVSAESAEPVGYFCFVPAPPDDGEPLRIRAWTTDAERAKSIGEIIGRKMEPLYRAPAQPATAWRVWWVSLNTARTELFEDHAKAADKARETGGCVIPLYASQPSPAATVETKDLAIEVARNRIAELVNERDAALARCSAASEVPFLTGEALRQSLRGSDCLAAEAEVNGRSEEQELERLAEIAERAKQHWLAANRLAAEPQPTAGSEPAAWLSTGDNHRGLWREKPDLGDGFQVQPLYLRDEPQGVLTRDAMVAAILEQKYPHRTDRQKWIDAFKVGDHGRIPGMEYRYATSDAFRFSDAILALPRPEHS